MKVYSLAKDQDLFRKVEVEVLLSPGLPQMHFIGLADQVIKESVHRIKSAIRKQGFEYPLTQQILVNIRPNNLKKHSCGIELAIAAAILWETEQLAKPLEQKNLIIYGELGLGGEVFVPQDLFFASKVCEDGTLLTGICEGEFGFDRLCIRELKEINLAPSIPANLMKKKWQRPNWALDLDFSAEHANLIKLLALGGHSALLAGPAGSGKTTLAKALECFLPEPSAFEAKEIEGNWRPIIHPHHSATPLAMIGGGNPPKQGEISRAHRGLIILDEFLEFHPRVQEALREPMESGRIRLARGSQAREFDCLAQIVGTTNLCPCGDLLPGKMISCGYSRTRCDSYRMRLSGPVLDRFHILVLIQNGNKSAKTIRGEKILQDLFKIWEQNNDSTLLKGSENQDELNKFLPETGSRRRKLSILAVAKTWAKIDHSQTPQARHFQQASKYCYESFNKLRSF